MPSFNPDRREIDKRAFELYRVQHVTSKLYWSGKGFDQKDKKKAVLVCFRVLAALKAEHIHIKDELIVKDRRNDATWSHLVPKLSAC